MQRRSGLFIIVLCPLAGAFEALGGCGGATSGEATLDAADGAEAGVSVDAAVDAPTLPPPECTPKAPLLRIADVPTLFGGSLRARSGRLFWNAGSEVTSGSELWSMSRDGSDRQKLFTYPTSPTGKWLSYDADSEAVYIVVSDGLIVGGTSQILRGARDHEDVVQLGSFDPDLRLVGLDDNNVFVTEVGHSRFHRFPKTGGALEEIASGYTTTYLQVQPPYLWALESGIDRYDLLQYNSKATRILQFPCESLTASAQYFLCARKERVTRYDVDGGDPLRLWDFVGNGYITLQADSIVDDHVIVLDTPAGEDFWSVYAVPLAGGPARLVADCIYRSQIAVDGDDVFVLEDPANTGRRGGFFRASWRAPASDAGADAGDAGL